MKNKKTAKGKLIKKCDELFSKIIRLRGSCQKCGKSENLQCAHIIGRTNMQTRHDTDNALCLCLRHHIYWAHKEPFEFVHWVEELKGEGFYAELKRKADLIAPIDWEARYQGLKEMYERSVNA